MITKEEARQMLESVYLVKAAKILAKIEKMIRKTIIKKGEVEVTYKDKELRNLEIYFIVEKKLIAAGFKVEWHLDKIDISW